MGQCPDCDSVKIFPGVNEGDGKCSVCHGDGYGDFFSRIGGGGKGQCYNCGGSGDCPTCGGSGTVDGK